MKAYYATAASAAVLAFALVTGPAAPAGSQELPAYAASRNFVWLAQNWTAEDRAAFHNQSQGTVTFPIPATWFLALEQPGASMNPGMFTDPAYLDRFGFIRGVRDPVHNKEGLPVGFARTTTIDPTSNKAVDRFGFTCAACHTGRIEYRGTTMLIDGGPAMTDLGKFREALSKSLIMAALPTRFPRFAERVLGPNHTKEQRKALKDELDSIIHKGIREALEHRDDKGSVEEGFGRLDALNRIGNVVFGTQMGIEKNVAPLTAPVAYPHIWDTSWFDWVQYNGSIEQPMVRNAGEAMGVVAIVNYKDGPTPRFTSTVPVDKLHGLEEALGGKTQPTAGNQFTGLRSPRWPEDILPAIRPELAAQGAALYDQMCKACHLPPVGSSEFWNSPRWLKANEHGERYLQMTMVPVDRIGTDPAQAADMKARTVRVPLVLGLKDQVRVDGSDGIYPFGWALGQLVEKVVDRWYDSHGTPAPQRAKMNGFRPNGIRAGIGANSTPAYKARPLNGIWATAPYLHNGSVPTLWDLLSPYSERPRVFWLGNREFDPVKVGYVTGEVKGGFKLVTADRKGRPVRGNANTGHLFETPADPAKPRPGTIGRTLTPAERTALVEYLKTL